MARPRVLVAWELGGNLGHVTKIARIVEHLQGEVDLHIALREPWQLRFVAPGLSCNLLPAPYAPSRRLHKHEDPAENYAGILLTEGWDQQQKLGGLFEAWRGLFASVNPDVLIAQSAPTALFAARSFGLKTAVVGGGYDNPPLCLPMPVFLASSAADRHKNFDIAKRQEAQALSTANKVLVDHGVKQADRFCDLITPDLSLLVCWPFDDHYGARHKLQPGHAPYLGPIISYEAGARYRWAERGGARIFAYLRPGAPQAGKGLQALAAMGQRQNVICAAPGLSNEARQSLQDCNVQVEDGPIQLAPLLPDCDLGLSHSSHGISAAFVAAGIRQVCLPNHREQSMHARALAEHGLGVGLEGHFGPETVIKCMADLMDDQAALARIQQTARDISERFPTDSASTAANQLRMLIENDGRN